MSVSRKWAVLAASAAAVALVGTGCDSNSSNDSTPGTNPGNPVSSLTSSAKSTESASSTATTESGAPSSSTSGTAAPAASTMIPSPSGQQIEVAGGILAKYTEAGGPTGVLGAPTGPAQTVGDGGHYQEFAGGAIFYSEGTGAHVVWGDIRTAYDEHGGPGGALGFPTSDETDAPGGKQSAFQHGKITWNSTTRATSIEAS